MPSPTMASEPYFGSLQSKVESAYQNPSSAYQERAAHLAAYQQQLEDQQRHEQQLIATHQQAAAAQRDAAAAQASMETTQYLQPGRLLQEAARRAEIAVLMRDLEGVDLR